MIALFTDFGLGDPYPGQVRAVLARDAPAVPVVDLLHTAPDFDVRASSYLLAALVPAFPADSIFVCVVDPAVGTEQAAVVLEAGPYRFVAPDNGLVEIVARRWPAASCRAVTWRPETLSDSFHGRDLYAPVAARLATGTALPSRPHRLYPEAASWPDDLPAVIYVDHYGNAMTGLRAGMLAPGRRLGVAGRELPYARTFAETPPGEPFWHFNAHGLIEVSVNRGSAARALGLAVGTAVGLPA